MKEIVEVAIGLPVSKTFHYRIPERMRESIQAGMRVLVPFKGRKVTGFTLDLLDHPPPGVEEKLKDLEDLLDEAPLVDRPMLQFCRWISDYYLHPLGEVIKTSLPPGLHLKSEFYLSPTQAGMDRLSTDALVPIQQKVLTEIQRHRQMTLKSLLKKFSGEISRAQLFSWKKQGLLELEVGIMPTLIKPKFERVLQFKEGISDQPISKKQLDILRWLEKKREAPYSELRKQFKSPSKAIRSLEEGGWVSVFRKESFRELSVCFELKPYPKPEPTSHQRSVLDALSKGIHSQRFSPFLLYGVTGSGKTEIYLRAIEEVLAQGKETLVLVPEISLTPQLLSRFKDRFGNNLGLLHSGLGAGERYDQWRRVWRGDVKIAIGARSAIFAPFRKLGMIIVDEEHDPSYKQEEKLKYHARDLAVVRAKQADATLLLGSATPSLESFHNAKEGRFTLLSLPERVEGKPLPKVEVVDVKKGEGLLSERVREALQRTLRDKKQSLLFLNRRGFANFILCPDCGLTFKCPNCSVTLTHHLRVRLLQCHYCEYRVPAPGDCPRCGSHRLRGVGIGTERLETEIRTLFPDVQVERMDSDTTAHKRAHQQILKKLESGQIDILIGTQMIVKGHDFPNVTFVGVVSADTSLHFPDFRSSERTFQLLTQVAGRAGRGDTRGEVIIQTLNPDHYSILRATEHDFVGFYQEEIGFRKALDYPPFTRLINFRLAGNSEKKTQVAAEALGQLGDALLKQDYRKGIEILGPSVAPFPKMRGRYRFHMLAKGKNSRWLHQFARNVILQSEDFTKGKGVTLEVDVDPVFIL